MTNSILPNYDKANHKSEIFLDMKKYIKEIMISKPEIIEKAIKDRTIIIKSLKADIEHRKIAFKEIENRYDDQALIIKNQLDEINKLKDQNEKLLNTNKTISTELNSANLTITVDKKTKEQELSYRLEKIADKIPGKIGKIIFKIVSSPDVLKYILMAVFCLLFVASLVGWGAIATVIKPLIALFG